MHDSHIPLLQLYKTNVESFLLCVKLWVEVTVLYVQIWKKVVPGFENMTNRSPNPNLTTII